MPGLLLESPAIGVVVLVASGTGDTEHSPATNVATTIAMECYGNHAKCEIGDKAIKMHALR